MTQAAARLVSVIIPVYNGARYLGEAIDSVLAQTYSSLELIVVDDDSTDASAAVAAAFAPRLTYVWQAHAGSGAARNRGLAESRGAYLAFLDADDIWLSDKLTLQMAAFDANPELDLVFGQVEQFRSPDLKGDRPPLPPGLAFMNGLAPGALVARRDAFQRVGGFGTNWHVGDFVDWYVRATELGLKNASLPQIVLKRRWHDANLTLRERHSRVEYVQIIKQSLDRRRGGAGSA